MKMKHAWVLLAIAGGALLPVRAMQAQPTQTVEGAQKFLAKLVEGGVVYVDAYIPKMAYTVSRQKWKKKFLQGMVLIEDTTETQTRSYVVKVLKLDSYDDRRGANDPCMTVVRQVDLDPKYLSKADDDTTYSDGSGRYKYTYTNPVYRVIYIDWRKAVVNRDIDTWTQGDDIKTFRNANAVAAWDSQSSIQFRSGDKEMLDRIEYAMKFLKMSCDQTADTGF
jgi:hypothetical protein